MVYVILNNRVADNRTRPERQMPAVRSLLLSVALGACTVSLLAQTETRPRPPSHYQTSQFLSQTSTLLGVSNMPSSWEAFPEFEALRRASPSARAGFMSAILRELDKSEAKAFGGAKQEGLLTLTGLLARLAMSHSLLNA